MSYAELSRLAGVGGFKLPPTIEEAADVRNKLVQAVAELRKERPVEYSANIAGTALFRTTSQSGEVPDLLKVTFEAIEAPRIHAEALIVGDWAVEKATDQITSTVRASANEIVTDSLRPAFLNVLTETRKLPKDTPTTAEAAVRGNREAYLKLTALAERFGAIKAAAELLYGAGADNHKMFADTKAGPDHNSVQYRYTEPRGPSEHLARLLWLANASDAQPYLPTNAERDAALRAFTYQPVSAAHSAAVNN
jgi:hypothetical protein